MARFHCGSVYYPKRSEVELQLDGALMERYLPVDDGESSRKPLIVRRSARHLNPLVTASRFNEDLWWNKNQLVIFHLDQGKKVREIAGIVEKDLGRSKLSGNGSVTCAQPNPHWPPPAEARG